MGERTLSALRRLAGESFSDCWRVAPNEKNAPVNSPAPANGKSGEAKPTKPGALCSRRSLRPNKPVRLCSDIWSAITHHLDGPLGEIEIWPHVCTALAASLAHKPSLVSDSLDSWAIRGRSGRRFGAIRARQVYVRPTALCRCSVLRKL